jgi:hypothetical protein
MLNNYEQSTAMSSSKFYRFRIINTLLHCFLLLNLLFSCNNRESLHCEPITTIIDTSNIQKINFFLDASGSMSGLLTSNDTASFKVKVPYLLSMIHREFTDSKKAFYILRDINSPVESIQFLEARDRLIPAGRLNNLSGTTNIPQMLKTIIDSNGSDVINILITDGIYSPTERTQTSQSARQIYDVFSKKSATSIIALKGPFLKINSNSPYYFFVLGQPQNIIKIKPIFKEVFRQYEVIDFGFPEKEIYYTIIPNVDNTGAGTPEKCANDERFLFIDQVDRKKQLRFWVGINLSNIGAYLNDNSYIKNNLKINPSGIKAEIGQILNSIEFSKKDLEDDDENLAQKCTHFIEIIIGEFEEKTGKFNLELKKDPIPTWINYYNHNIDDSADTKRNTTYKLNEIISGMISAYKENGEEYFFRNAIIDLKRK